MKDKKGGDLICKRPETIVEARFSLTKKQNDILDIVFATIENDDKLAYEIDISKYVKLYQLQNQSNVYSDIKKAVKSFEGKGFRILNKENMREDYFPWFSRITYLDGESKVIVELGKTLKQIFLDVKRACFYNIQYTINFRSVYGQRLYYYLKSFEDTGFRVDNIEELKLKLVCPTSYKNYADFNRFVLKPAQEDINGNSDISFEYEPKYTGKKITRIEFYIKSNKNNNWAENEISATSEEYAKEMSKETGIKEVLKILQGHKVNQIDALKIYQNSNEDIEYIAKVYEYSKKQDVKNLIGYMKKMVLPGVLKEDIINSKVDSFNNYEQRSYDYEELEKKLLGWN